MKFVECFLAGRKEFEQRRGPEDYVLPRLGNFDALLINVPIDFQQGPMPDGEEPPVGLGRIASYANKLRDHQVGIFDIHRLRKPDGSRISIDEARETFTHFKEKGLKVVGLNPTSVNVEAGIEIAQVCDELEIPYVLGGYFATLSDAEMTKKCFPKALALVKRDGEIAFSDILDRVKNFKGKIEGNDNLYHDLKLGELSGVCQPGEDKQDGILAKKIDINSLPIVTPSEYYVNHLEYRKINGKNRKEATLYITDGCPYDCSFCASPIMKLRDWGHPGMKRFVDEIEVALEDGADAIHCTDDLIFTKGEHIDELYQELLERDLLGKFVWRGMARANIVDKLSEQRLEKLKKTGCWQLALGVESGSPRILKDVVHKRLEPATVISATKKLTAHEIGTKGFFIFGFPDESREDMEMSYELAMEMARNGATGIAAFEFHPYPGTEIYETMKQTTPDIISQLSYLQVDWEAIDKDDMVGVAPASERIKKTSMWLPPEMKISQLPASEVQKIVNRTLNDFDAILNARKEAAEKVKLIERMKAITGLESIIAGGLALTTALTSFPLPAALGALMMGDAARRSNVIDEIEKSMTPAV